MSSEARNPIPYKSLDVGSLQQIRTKYEVKRHLELFADSNASDLETGSSVVSDSLNGRLELAIMRLAAHGAFMVLIEDSHVHFIAGSHKLNSNDTLSEVKFGTGEDTCLHATDADLSIWHWLFRKTITRNVSAPANQTFTVPALRHNERTAKLSTVNGSPHLSFYAGVPLISKGDHAIGALFVVNTTDRCPLSTSEEELLKNTAKKCLQVLDQAQGQRFHNRWTSMQQQLHSFTQTHAVRAHTLEEAQTYQGRRPTTTTRANEKEPERVDLEIVAQEVLTELETPHVEGEESERLINAQIDCEKSVPQYIRTQDTRMPDAKADNGSERSTAVRPGETVYRAVFRRAAQCLQIALEADGVLFADGLTGFHGNDQAAAESERELEREVANPPQKDSYALGGDPELNTRVYTSPEFKKGVNSTRTTEILGISYHPDQSGRLSTSNPSNGLVGFDEAFLRRLMDRHPTSAMWYFTDTHMMRVKEGVISEVDPQNDEERRLKSKFPKLKQLIFVPLYDLTSGKRLSACFVWRNRANPVFTDAADVGSLKMFLQVVESEIGRHDTTAAAKQKDTFVSSVSHELRTPLHGILGAVQLLEESGLDPLQKSLADIITSCGSTLHETLTSVLSYAKINQFKRRQQEYRQSHLLDSEWALADKTRFVSFHPDPDFQGLYMRTNVAMLCEELVGVAESGRSFQNSANEEVIIVCNVSHEDNWSYLTEPGALRRIVINLIGNALKYTKTGSVIVSLTASKLAKESPETTGLDRDTGRTLTFSIRDTGKGMSKGFLQDHLFVPFTQEDSTSSHGVGLGMSIVKNLVSLLGGEIQVQSKVGSGTKVDVALPMRIYDSKEDTPAESRFEQNIKTLRARKLSIIIFGFPDFARSSLETYLREWYNCALLDITDNALPDIVIVDEGDEEVLERVKKTAHIYGRRAVLLSTVLVISKMVRRMDTIEGYKKWERIPRPIGPSNIAKGLLGCLPKLDELKEHGVDMESDVRDSEPQMDERTEELSSNNPVGISAELPMWAFERLELANSHDTASSREELSSSSSTANRDPPPKTSEVSTGNEDSKRDSAIRILLVDDNILNLKLLRAFFRKNGYHDVQQAKHGGEAVEAFRQCAKGFDIVFMDMSMPIMDGFEATRQIRRLETEQKRSSPSRRTFITALTGLASASDEDEAFKAGVDLYLTKPVQFPRLSTLLRECEEGSLKPSRRSSSSE